VNLSLVCALYRYAWALFKAENDCMTDILVVGMVNNKADNFVTSGNAILRFEMIRYFNGSDILCRKNLSSK
jgi:hypothetical protein